MGAFILFPVLMFILFIASVLGVTDYVHAETLVHAAAQTAVAAAAQDAMAVTGSGDYVTIGTNSLKVDGSSADSTIQSMLSNKPYITGWSCGAAGIDYSCLVHFSVSMPFVGHVNGSTSASASTVVVRQNANPIPSGPPNIPIFSGGSTNLQKGWTTTNPAPSYAAGYGTSPKQDGGWANVETGGSASYSFTVAANQSSTITYGIPAGGYTNTPPTNVYINGVLQASINTSTGSSPAPSAEYLWSYTFGPGTYQIAFTGGNTNVYGLWASNLSAITPASNFFPAGSFPNGLWESTPGNCHAWNPSKAQLSASMQRNTHDLMPAMVLSGSYGNACETQAISMPHQLVGGDTFLVQLAAQTQGPLSVGPSICIWDSQANECLPASWSPSTSDVSQWTSFNITMTLPKSYHNGNNLTLFLYSGETDGGPPAVNAYSDVQMYVGG